MIRPIQTFDVTLKSGGSFQIDATDFEPSGSSVSFYREYPNNDAYGNPTRCTYIGYYSDVSSVTLSEE